jgi:phage/plasmid-associated DNA primase
MFINSFGGYVDSFNAECLAYTGSNDTKDEASKNRWAYLICFARLIFSNEANMRKVFNGNDIKKISSGGDKIIGRTHNKEETQFVPHFTAFCMLNDIPKIDPMDDAVYERLEYCEFKKQFVKTPTEIYHIQADPDLDEKIRQPKFIRGFIHLILDGYKYFLEHGQPKFNACAKDEWTEGDRKDKNLKELLHNEFDITNNKNDFVSVAEMNKFRNKYKKDFLTVSNKRFNEIIQELFKISQTRKGKECVRGWAGIKQKTNDTDWFN